MWPWGVDMENAVVELSGNLINVERARHFETAIDVVGPKLGP